MDLALAGAGIRDGAGQKSHMLESVTVVNTRD